MLVVLHHSLLHLGAPRDTWLGVFDDFMKDLRMPLFFFVACVLAVKWSTVPFTALVNGKLRFLVWPLGVWSIVILGYNIGGYFWGPPIYDPPAQSAVRFLLTPFLPNAELWFLWALTFAFIVAWCTRRVPTWLLLTVVVGISIGVGPHVPSVPGQTLTYMVFFFVGLRGRTMAMSATDRISGRAWILLIPAAAAYFGLVWIAEYDPFNVVSFLARMAGVLLGVVIALCAHRVDLLRRVGADTLPIYVAHSAVIAVIGWVLVAVGIDWAIPGVAVVVPLVVMVIAATMWIGERYRETWVFSPPLWFAVRERLPQTAE